MNPNNEKCKYGPGRPRPNRDKRWTPPTKPAATDNDKLHSISLELAMSARRQEIALWSHIGRQVPPSVYRGLR